MRMTDTIDVNAMQYAAQCLAMGKALGFDDEILRLAFSEYCSKDKEAATDYADWHIEWQRFYQEVFGIAVDLSSVAIPNEQPGFGWMIVVAKSITLNQVWAKCKEKFASYSYFGDNLDEVVPINDRNSEAAYAKRFRDRAEADEELKNLSANQLKKRKIKSITLLERLLLELWYFWKTGQHLDIQNITLCAGSQCLDGAVPNVYWFDDRLRVCYYLPDNRSASLRARAAV